MSPTEDALGDRLESVACTMELSSDYSDAEVFLWRALARHVDPEAFERSGKIAVDGAWIERIASNGAAAAGHDAAALHAAVEALVEKDRLAVDRRDGGDVCYRLLLHSPWV